MDRVIRIAAFAVGYIGTALLLALLVRRFILAFALVKGRSMMDTLRDKEIMLMLRYGLFGKPKRFDVVICRYPKRKGLFVKRLIALPGETLAIIDNVLYINGEVVAESYSRRNMLRDLEERTLSADEYFVMGDNRPASSDSRRIGPLHSKQLLGRVTHVLFPFKRMRKIH